MSSTTAEEEQSTNADASVDFINVQVVLPDGTSLLIPNVPTNESTHFVRQNLVEFQETTSLTCYRLDILYVVDLSGNNLEVDGKCSDFVEIMSYIPPNTKDLALALIPECYDQKSVLTQIKRTREILRNPPFAKASFTSNSASEKQPVMDNTPTAATDVCEKTPVLETLASLGTPIKLSTFYSDILFRTSHTDREGFIQSSEARKQLSESVKSVFTSGWNPPPQHRKLQGDLMYLEVITAKEGTLYMTAVTSGFYVNKSNRGHFDPTPALNHHFAHDLFTCLLSASATLRAGWEAVRKAPDNMAVKEQPSTAPTNNIVGESSDAEVAASADEVAAANTTNSNDTAAAPTTTIDTSALDMLAWMYRDGRGEDVALTPQWNAYPASETTADTKQGYDLFRAQEKFGSLHGMEDLGAQREWNDEIQQISALKPNSLAEKVLKAKMEYKLMTEFTDACKQTAVAIADGLIAAAPLTDPEGAPIYVYNGIFFSKTEGSKDDAFKICNTDDAFAKITGREMQNQRLVRMYRLEGVGTVLCTLVDYKGQRFIGQSIVPGILSAGENSASLLYGALERGKNITVKNSSLKVFEELGEHLHLPTRVLPLVPVPCTQEEIEAQEVMEQKRIAIAEAAAAEGGQGSMLVDQQQNQVSLHIDEEDRVDIINAGTDKAGQRHCGPVEGKLLRGADGRKYLLELMRLTPRDANFVETAKGGTGKVPAELLEATDKDLNVTHVLRVEMVKIYVQHKLSAARQEIVRELGDKETALRKASLPDKPDAAVANATAAEKERQTGDVTAADSTVPTTESNEKEEEQLPALSPEVQKELTVEYEEKFSKITPQALGLEANPNCFLGFPVDVDPSVVEKDESLARDMAVFLYDTLLPNATRQVIEGDVQVKDADALVAYLHRVGINIRYIGALVDLAAQQETTDADLLKDGRQRLKKMPLFWREMLVVELLARAVKHLLNSYFRSSKAVYNAPAQTISMMLNHIFSVFYTKNDEDVAAKDNKADAEASVPSVTVKNKKNKKKGTGRGSTNSNAAIDHNTKPQPTLPPAADVGMVDVTGSTEECLNALSTIIARRYCANYSFVSAPLASTSETDKAGATENTAQEKKEDNMEGKKQEDEFRIVEGNSFLRFLRERISPLSLLRRICQQSGLCIATKDYNFSSSTSPFEAADIISLIPKVTSCEPEMILPEFHEILNGGMNALRSGDIPMAYEVSQHAAQIIQQVTGPHHKHAIRAMDQVATVLLQASDKAAAAEVFSRSLALANQSIGLDRQDAVVSHVNIGMLQCELGNLKAAMQHLMTARYVLTLTAGVDHTEMSNIYTHMATVYDRAGDFHAASACLNLARTLCCDMLSSCYLVITLAEVCFRHKHFEHAVDQQTRAYRLLKELLGEDEPTLVSIKQTLEVYMRAQTEQHSAQAQQQMEQLALAIKQQRLQQQQQQQKRQRMKKSDDGGVTHVSKCTSKASMAASRVIPFNLDDDSEDYVNGVAGAGPGKKSSGGKKGSKKGKKVNSVVTPKCFLWWRVITTSLIVY